MKIRKEVAEARARMFEEAMEHLNGAVTDDELEQAAIPYVQTQIRKLAQLWWEIALR